MKFKPLSKKQKRIIRNIIDFAPDFLGGLSIVGMMFILLVVFA